MKIRTPQLPQRHVLEEWEKIIIIGILYTLGWFLFIIISYLFSLVGQKEHHFPIVILAALLLPAGIVISFVKGWRGSLLAALLVFPSAGTLIGWDLLHGSNSSTFEYALTMMTTIGVVSVVGLFIRPVVRSFGILVLGGVVIAAMVFIFNRSIMAFLGLDYVGLTPIEILTLTTNGATVLLEIRSCVIKEGLTLDEIIDSLIMRSLMGIGNHFRKRGSISVKKEKNAEERPVFKFAAKIANSLLAYRYGLKLQGVEESHRTILTEALIIHSPKKIQGLLRKVTGRNKPLPQYTVHLVYIEVSEGS